MKPNVNKKIKHMGMTMTEEKHQKWHEEQHEMAIMLHNITEGVATAVQLRKAGTKPWKITVFTLLPSLAEPIAALLDAATLSR